MNITRRTIIGEYLRVRKGGEVIRGSIIVTVATNLGYKINQNGDNSFVRKVLREFLDQEISCGAHQLSRGTSYKANEPPVENDNHRDAHQQNIQSGSLHMIPA